MAKQSVPERQIISLTEWLKSQDTGEPFSWASRNCCTFVGDWVRNLTGVDPSSSYDKPDGPVSARRILGDCEEAWTKALQTEPFDGWMAQAGDIVMAESEGNGVGYVMGVCTGRRIVSLSETGALFQFPILLAVKAWRIPA